MVGQDLGKSVGASGVHKVSQELNVLGTELLLVLHVHIGEVSLADLDNRQVICINMSDKYSY